MSTFSPQIAHEEKKARQTERARFLTMVYEGQLKIGDLIELAATDTDTGLNLRKIYLVDLLEAHFHLSRHMSLKLLDRIVERCGGAHKKTRLLTLTWLLDSRTSNKRLLIFADAITPLRGTTPTPFFPF